MKNRLILFLAAVLIGAGFYSGCQKETADGKSPKSIVVTYSIIGSLVRELAGDAFAVRVLIPDGLDPHEWSPSAADIEALSKAALVVENGLGLEEGLEDALAQARDSGNRFFTFADHIRVRRVGEGEGIPSGDPDQATGAEDPHLWLDPLTVKAALLALADYIKREFAIDLSQSAAALSQKLDGLDAFIKTRVAGLGPEKRKLVTGHESLGYFAERYGFKLVGAIVPGLTSQAEVSAADLAALKKLIAENRVKVIFSETGSSPKVAEALARETGAGTVELATHTLPADRSYFTFMRDLTEAICGSLD